MNGLNTAVLAFEPTRAEHNGCDITRSTKGHLLFRRYPSKTQEEHLENLEKVPGNLEQNGLTLHREKLFSVKYIPDDVTHTTTTVTLAAHVRRGLKIISSR